MNDPYNPLDTFNLARSIEAEILTNRVNHWRNFATLKVLEFMPSITVAVTPPTSHWHDHWEVRWRSQYMSEKPFPWGAALGGLLATRR